MMGVVGRPSFLRKIKDRFLHFRNRYGFTEISRRWQGHRLFHLLIHSASVGDIYLLVSSEIDDIPAHLEADQSRRINNAIYALTFVLTPLATATAICSAPPSIHSWKNSRKALLGGSPGMSCSSSLWLRSA
jgi:hypothetical protein